MTLGQAFVVLLLILGISTPFTALAAYSFGWWWRGRHEAKIRIEREPLNAP